MEIDLPTWLDACFMQKVLQKAEKDESIEVFSITVKPGTAIQVNFASDIYRIDLKFLRIHNGHNITETRSVIAKVGSEGSPWKKMVLNTGIFETEISMLSETLPIMNRMLSEIGMTALAPQCLHAQNETPIHMILEDLMSRSFQMATSQLTEGLDLDHALLAIRNIAVFHAASVALAEQNPKVPLTKYTKGMFHKDRPAMVTTYYKANTKILGEQVAKWPELSPRISEKILKLSDIVYEKGCKSTQFCKDDFNVLNHGDFSAMNIMFRYDEQQKPIDLTFVDFQTSYYGSPAIDILYFFGLSSSDDVRANHRNTLLHVYHNSLTTTMEKLKCNTKAPSYDNLQIILRERAFYEVIISMTTLAFVRSDSNAEKTMSSDGKYIGNPGYQGKLYRQIMSRVLPLYDSWGLLDVY